MNAPTGGTWTVEAGPGIYSNRLTIVELLAFDGGAPQTLRIVTDAPEYGDSWADADLIASAPELKGEVYLLAKEVDRMITERARMAEEIAQLRRAMSGCADCEEALAVELANATREPQP